MHILGLNFNHDGAVVVLSDGRISGWVMTERRSRVKKHPGVRRCDLDAALRQAGISLEDISLCCLANLRLMDSPEVVEHYGTDFSETWAPFELARDRSGRRVRLEGAGGPVSLAATVNPPHHRLHNALVYYTSPFEAAACFSLDVAGSAAALGKGNTLSSIRLPGGRSCTAGYVYGAASRALGLTALFGAGKTMALAPYGRDAGLALPPGLDTWSRVDAAVEALCATAAQDPVLVDDGGRSWNASLADAAQRFLESELDRVLEELFVAARSAGIPPNLCLSGGTALNVVANERCFARSRFERIFLHPACGDDGTAIGAALFHWHHTLGNPKRAWTHPELTSGVERYGPEELETAIASRTAELAIDRDALATTEAARVLAAGGTVGWFEGPGELGPRALGHRSILADPRRPGMQDYLNREIKLRESFRPFAPVVLRERAREWFSMADSPFMLRAADVIADGIPAVRHVDGTARVQTLDRDHNPGLFRLIEEFETLTGVPVLLNTSFNRRGEPIVESPADAIDAFLGLGLDGLVLEGLWIRPARALSLESLAGLRPPLPRSIVPSSVC